MQDVIRHNHGLGENEQIHLQNGINKFRNMEYEGAKIDFENILAVKPDSVIALYYRGQIALNMSQPGPAITYFEKANSINSESVDVLVALALAHVKNSNYSVALPYFEKAREIEPERKDIIFNILVCNIFLKNYEKIDLTYAEKILDSFSINLIKVRLALSLSEIEKANQLLELFNTQNITTDHKYQISNLYLALGRNDDALNLLTDCIVQDDCTLEIKSSLIELYERVNNLDAAIDLISSILNGRSLDQFPDRLKLSFFKVYVSAKSYENALLIAKDITFSNLSHEASTLFFEYSGKLFDSIKNYDMAINAFAHMNQNKIIDAQRQNIVSKEYLNFVNSMKNGVKSSDVKLIDKKENFTNITEVCFLIGFPRSGTTLLENMLKAHSKIETLEELPFISRLFSSQNFSSFSDILNLNSEEIFSIRNQYLELTQTKKVENGVIIDKLPLNAIYLPFIAKIFPNAKIINVKRHPLDTVLSNWMQNYVLNRAMSVMQNLNEIRLLFELVHSIVEITSEKFKLDKCDVSYEKLVENFECEIKKILNFLGLGWEDSIRFYRDKVNKREHIKTPSYQQVSQPIYKKSVYKWKNYKKLFKNDTSRWEALIVNSSYDK